MSLIRKLKAEAPRRSAISLVLSRCCAAHGGELVEWVAGETGGGSEKNFDKLAARLRRKRAKVLVAATGQALVDTQERAERVLDSCAARGWEFVQINGPDTTTPGGRLVLESFLRTQRVQPPPCSAPLPDRELILRVTGHESTDLFDRRGHLDLAAMDDALLRNDRRFASFRNVLDFGCGCGRLLRRLPLWCPQAELTGCDFDEAAIGWVQKNLTSVDARRTEPLPPLPFSEGAFDLVIGFSVFTHLDERFQDAWLEELRRVSSPGGILLLTVNGQVGWEWHRENPLFIAQERVAELDRAWSEEGIVFWRDDGWENLFPDFYHTTFHAPWYLEKHWGAHFEVLEIAEGAAGGVQDLVVLRRSI